MDVNGLHWIASDGWGKQQPLVKGVEDIAEGAVTVELEYRNMKGFDQYIESLTPKTNTRNPWFDEYWEEKFHCFLNKNYSKEIIESQTYRICNDSLRIGAHNGYIQDAKVQFVIDGVYAFAHALDKLRKDVCGENEGVCEEIMRIPGGTFYRNYLLNVSFKGKS